MADDKKKKDLLRRIREWLLKKSKGAKAGGRPGLEQIEQEMKDEKKK